MWMAQAMNDTKCLDVCRHLSCCIPNCWTHLSQPNFALTHVPIPSIPSVAKSRSEVYVMLTQRKKWFSHSCQATWSESYSRDANAFLSDAHQATQTSFAWPFALFLMILQDSLHFPCSNHLLNTAAFWGVFTSFLCKWQKFLAAVDTWGLW